MIDSIGIQILKILQRKARIPNVEVARRVGMAPSAVLERIRKLENQGYIDGYEVRLNPSRFHRQLVVFAWVRTTGGHDVGSVGDRLAALSAVQEVHYVSGEDAFLVKIRVADTCALDRLLREQIRPVEGVQSVRTHIALNTVKESAHIPIEADDDGDAAPALRPSPKPSD
ncbi:MAG: Lrp/AsnC family transcriptional regulator [Desulfobacterales bacterium]|nr:Lrp/AsnC family transcriptional regulator [Desulfobacterales bacterium]